MAQPVPVSDFAWYVGAAERLAAGMGYSMPDGSATAYWPIGWPLVLSLVFRLGLGLDGAYGLQILFGAATAGLVYVGARRIDVGTKPAAVAALLFALLPGQAAAAAILGTEPLFTFLVTAGLIVLLGRPPTMKRIVLSAAVMGAATLLRPTMLIWPPVLLVILLTQRVPPRRALAFAGMTALVIVLVIAPLTIRNAVRFGAFVPVSTNGGINLWQGTKVDDGYWAPVGPIMHLPTEVERDAAARKTAINYWIQHPIEMINRVPAKLRSLWANDDDALYWIHLGGRVNDVDYRSWVGFGDLWYWATLGFAFAGALRAWRGRRDVFLLLVGFVGSYTLLFAFFPAWSRFHQPLIPAIGILAACAIASAWPPASNQPPNRADPDASTSPLASFIGRRHRSFLAFPNSSSTYAIFSGWFATAPCVRAGLIHLSSLESTRACVVPVAAPERVGEVAP